MEGTLKVSLSEVPTVPLFRDRYIYFSPVFLIHLSSRNPGKVTEVRQLHISRWSASLPGRRNEEPEPGPPFFLSVPTVETCV